MNNPVLSVLALVVLLGGCSAVGVIASSDPRVKVGQAEEMQRQGRIFRAKQLLDEAAEIVQKQGDEAAAAEVYRGYGLFYRDGGSGDTILAVPGRVTASPGGLAKAQDYFTQAATLFEKHKVYDRLSNVHFLMAQVYYRMDDKAKSCKSLDDSLSANRQAIAAHPNVKIELMPGITSFEQGIARAKSEVGCPA
jgi:tetratricopeptide (TPR) repeat protein